MRRYQLTIGDKVFAVEIVSVQGDEAQVVVNGRSYEVKFSSPASTSIVAPPPPSPKPAAPAGPALRPKAAPAPPEKMAVAKSLNAVTAPMPGLILEVLVNEGDRVKAGDTVVKLEAMKMENDLKCTASGVVAEVRVSKGASVAVGEPLVVITPE